MRWSLRFVPLLVWAGVLLGQSTSWRGAWTATGPGHGWKGTWTANVPDNPNIAFGTFTLDDESGKTVVQGTWSARKMEKRWEGAWQARVDNESYSGTWTARTPILSPSRLIDLLDLALSNPVMGSWHMGRNRSGAWSIRAQSE